MFHTNRPGGYGQSTEDYLEAIYILSKNNSGLRAVALSDYFEYKRSSVSVAVKNMHTAGLIYFDEGKHIKLTPKGLYIAKKTYEKHLFFKEMLLEAGVAPEIAEATACPIEHDISDSAFNMLRKMEYRFCE